MDLAGLRVVSSWTGVMADCLYAGCYVDCLQIEHLFRVLFCISSSVIMHEFIFPVHSNYSGFISSVVVKF